MAYIIHDGDNYLKQTNGKISIVKSIEQATKWTSLRKATNVCKFNTQSKELKGYHLDVEFIVQENKTASIAKPVELECDILDKAKEIGAFAKQLEGRRIYLLDQIHESELHIIDIEHAAEFYTLNASDGYKLYKLLHDERNRRRKYKDELQKIDLILGSSIKSSSIENLERSISGLDSRKYEPRVDKELFGKMKGA